MPDVRRLGGWSPYEDVIGYCRAVVLGSGLVLVSGTTSVVDGEVRHLGDAEGQLRRAIETVGEVLEAAGTSLPRVVRTRMYVVGRENCDAAGRAHAAFFADVRPAATMVVVAGLIHPEMLAEIEVEALMPDAPMPQHPRIVPA